MTLIAFTQTRDVVVDGKTIHIISALEWLLRCEDLGNCICIETQILMNIRGLEESKSVPMKNVI